MDMLQESSLVSKPRPPCCENSSFVNWLEARLDGLGLDGCLYSRCIAQLCQHPSAYLAQDDDGQECPGSILIRSRSGSDFTRFSEDLSPPPDNSELKQALTECLGAVGLNKTQTVELVSEIVEHFLEHQFLALKHIDKKQNESIDSGVCPSPEGSFQNYDEAFPPLSDDICPKVFSAGFEDIKQLVCRSSPVDLPVAPDPSSLPKPTFLQLSGDGSCVCERQLHSCPTDVFCVEQHHSGVAPQFVVPKCSEAMASAKVGSCPTRLEFGYSFGPYPPSNSACLKLPVESVEDQDMLVDAPKFVLHIINNDQLQLEAPEPEYNLWSNSTQWELMETDSTQFCLPRLDDEREKESYAHKKSSIVGCLQLPISPDTHFMPIRCETMQEAFEPPLADFDYAVDYWGEEEYYVLRQPTSARPLSSASTRSLPLKFKAIRPEKICQTQTDHYDLFAEQHQTETQWTLGESMVVDEVAQNANALGNVWTPLDLLSPLSQEGSEEDWPDRKNKNVLLGVGSSLWQQRSSNNLHQEQWGENIELLEIYNMNEPPSKELLDAAEDEDNMLLSYVGNISLIAPLETSTNT